MFELRISSFQVRLATSRFRLEHSVAANGRVKLMLPESTVLKTPSISEDQCSFLK